MPLVDHRPPPPPLNIHPLRLLLVAPLAAALFIVGLAVVARATADGAPAPRQVLGVAAMETDVKSEAGRPVTVPPAGDAGARDPAHDPAHDPAQVPAHDPANGTAPSDAEAGTMVEPNGDAPRDRPGALVTVSPDVGPGVDAGPASASGPPFSPTAVVSAAVVVVQACVADALRWDPSLGGPFAVVVDLGPLFAAEDGAAPPRLETPGLLSPVLANCLLRRAADVQLPPLGDVEVPLAVRARATLGADGTIAWSDALVTTAAPPRVNPDATTE
ncbi:MAG: hypothetical protein FJ137_20125 [Deltaproteobacteria bacterium]|nr:hypothetical protein [Deltaproteobacteria bacterium]